MKWVNNPKIKEIINENKFSPIVMLRNYCSTILISVYDLESNDEYDKKALEYLNELGFELSFIPSYSNNSLIVRVVNCDDTWIKEQLNSIGIRNYSLFDTILRMNKKSVEIIKNSWDEFKTYKSGEYSKMPVVPFEYLVNRGKVEYINEEAIELQSFKERQLRCYNNKLKHGFNVTDFQKEARFILKELVELMDAIEHNDVDNLIEELGDIVIFCYGIAEMAHKDLDAQVLKKMDINERRIYHRNEHGDFVRQDN